MATACISGSCHILQLTSKGNTSCRTKRSSGPRRRGISELRNNSAWVPVNRNVFATAQGLAAPGEARLARDDLLDLIAGEERGLRTQKDASKRSKIIQAIDGLTALGAHSITTDNELTAAWRMLWTTEKEQLFIVEKAPLFGTEAGDILQVIDIEKGTLKNVITFPPTGMFLVDSTIQVVSAQRVNFKFTSAALHIEGWRIPVPPFGQGWFDSVYLDEKIRVAKDIRGDYLVVDRAPSIPSIPD